MITNLERQETQYQVTLLLHTLGDEALKVYNGFHFNVDSENRTVEEIISKFDAFAVGEVNETYEMFIFNNRDQKEGETFESFHAAIRSLAKACSYCDACIKSVLLDRIVIGISDPTIQTTLLKDLNLTLETCVTICKAAENAIAQGQQLRPETVQRVVTQEER